MASKQPHQPTAKDAPGHESSAHNIWLAGLGALAQAQANAQAEGSKAFEALVQQGLAMQARTQALAKEQWDEAAQRLSALTTHGSDASWDRLGGIFQSRVARAIASLGLPAASDLHALEARIAALEAEVKKLQGAAAKAPRAPAAASTAPATKTATKTATKAAAKPIKKPAKSSTRRKAS